MIHPLQLLYAALLFSLAIAVSGSAHGQSEGDIHAQELSAELIQTRLEQVEASAAYTEETKSTLLDLYRSALASLETARAHHAARERFEQSRTSAPEQSKKLRAELAEPIEDDVLAGMGVDAGTTAQDVELKLRQERANEAAVGAKLTELEQELAAARARPQVARQRLTAANQDIKAVGEQLAESSSSDEDAAVAEARRWARLARARALSAEIHRLDQELLSHQMRVNLLELQVDHRARTLNRIEARVAALQTLLTQRRGQETAQLLAGVDPEALGEAARDPLVQELADDTRQLADELSKVSSALEKAGRSHERTEQALADLRHRYALTRQKVEVAGVSRALGRFLREEQRTLSPPGAYKRASRLREEQIAEAGLRQLRLEEQERDTREMDDFIDRMLAPLTASRAQAIRPAVARLSVAQHELLRKAIQANDDYLSALADIEYKAKQLNTISVEYRDFLAAQLLWVRTQKMIAISDLVALPGELFNFFAPQRWLDAAGVFLNLLIRSAWLKLAVVVVLLSVWKRRRWRERLRATAKTVGKPSVDGIGVTLSAVTITLLMALPWPIFTGLSGYLMAGALEATPASKAVGEGLLRITPLLFFLQFFRSLSIPGGVAEAHFRWSPRALKRLRRQINLLVFSLLLPGFLMVVNARFEDTPLGGVFSRLMLLVLAAAMVIFLQRLLAPQRGIAATLRRRPGEERGLRRQRFWMATAILIPAGVAVMALAGYMYSAITLLGRLIYSLWLVFGLVFLRELVVRWLLIVRRRLLLRQALDRRAAAREFRASGTETSVGGDFSVAAEETPTDIVALDTDTRKLLRVALFTAAILGLAAIWFSLLPAISALNEVTLWHSVRSIGGQEMAEAVTLRDLLIAVLIIVVTLVSARNVPSLIEIVLRQRPSITPGSRLAFSTLARYAIAVVGISVTLGIIGVNWSKLQWLIAALGVGIGFGLQEIVANFISGLIILMERPIRVGDVVTVGDVSGRVTRLQIRATTILTWDRQELLVPNKEFITGRVLNWSLSDEVIRIHFNVGIAYGSDVELALKLIEETADEHPNVLDDPKPLVTFEGFGDNALTLGLRCYVPALSTRLETITDLNRAINRKFNDAGLVFSFPQRDVHLDTSSPLELRITNNGKPSSPDAGP